ncbi:MAG: RagB/SusD family nutrient uptake outer membrane protein [Flavobacterium sp.]|nr:RagB/SusD family nutrient uptake outer membrane protein [Flavobacterium sp.]|tara:strand:+ start:26764 stop:28140 length:1377 start_codon:yes stop_codon:yes gene_type:complete
MMENKKINKVPGLLVFLCLLLLSSCSEFVEVDLPASQLPSQIIFEDPATARAAMSSIYGNMRDNGFLSGNLPGLSCVLGLYTDELDFYRQDIDYFYTNSLFAAQPAIKSYWNHGYSLIFAANAVIEGVRNSQSLPAELKAQLEGEALFVRALVHLYLNQLYGGVPYVTTTDYTVNGNVSRLPPIEVLQLIRQDLLDAASFLPDNPSVERVLPSKGAARSLLARTCLYAGWWDEAVLHSTAVIEGPLYQWVDDPAAVFLNNSTATIWQFMPADASLNTLEGDLFIFEVGPPPAIAISASLYNAFEIGDLRRSGWIREVTDGTDSWYHAFKYKQRTISGASTEYSILLRLAEQYLIRAEARAMTGNIEGAKADLNKVRQRAGLPDTDATDAMEIVNAVMAERRVELFTEFGHRFFDLQRTGSLDEALENIKPGWDSTDRLWPIPSDEIVINPNITQNPGY